MTKLLCVYVRVRACVFVSFNTAGPVLFAMIVIMLAAKHCLFDAARGLFVLAQVSVMQLQVDDGVPSDGCIDAVL